MTMAIQGKYSVVVWIYILCAQCFAHRVVRWLGLKRFVPWQCYPFSREYTWNPTQRIRELPESDTNTALNCKASIDRCRIVSCLLRQLFCGRRECQPNLQLSGIHVSSLLEQVGMNLHRVQLAQHRHPSQRNVAGFLGNS